MFGWEGRWSDLNSNSLEGGSFSSFSNSLTIRIQYSNFVFFQAGQNVDRRAALPSNGDVIFTATIIYL